MNYCKTFFAIIASCAFLLPAQALPSPDVPTKDTTAAAPANKLIELSFTSERNYPDPFTEVTLDVLFTDPQGHKFLVPGFWDGNNSWKVRYSSGVVGIHHYNTFCSEPGDKGLNGVSGKVEVRPYTGKNLLFQHGALRVADDHRHFG